MAKGRCLCGAVTFTVSGHLGESDACHCGQCRKWSGHYWASANVPREALAVEGAERVAWFQSSERVRRGFCSACGSVMFWDPIGKPVVAVALGALDAPTGTHLAKHIFTADKGDYYDIADGLPQTPQ